MPTIFVAKSVKLLAISCLIAHTYRLNAFAFFIIDIFSPFFFYCSTAWSSLLSKSLMSTLEVHNKRILKVLFRKPSLSLVKRIENCVLLFILFVFTKPRHTCVNITGFFTLVLRAIPALYLKLEHQLIPDLRFSLPILSGWPCLYQ